MTQKFKLAVSNVVGFEVKGRIFEEGSRPLEVKFRMMAERIPVQVYRDAVGEGSSATTRDFLAEHVRGWSGQRIVLDEGGQPADYCTEALDVLLSLIGMEPLILGAYLEALTVASTAEGRAKN